MRPVLGPLRVAGSFESRITNPWVLDCGALAGFQQPGTWESSKLGCITVKASRVIIYIRHALFALPSLLALQSHLALPSQAFCVAISSCVAISAAGFTPTNRNTYAW